MDYITLYRKYRPKVFAEIIGQEHVTRTLINALRSGKTSHAYLFSGPRGTGKTSTAKILAKALNCQNKTLGSEPSAQSSIEPCNKCFSCDSINRSSSVDVLEIDAASNRGIDEIRNLQERVHFAPSRGGKKVFIIDEVHMLTEFAFNALLKMIEEPPEHAVFILATTQPHKVIPTIVSRCQRFDFRRVLVPDIVNRLQEIASRENITAQESTLTVLARQAQGSVRDSIGLLDQLASFSDKKITAKALSEVLNLTESELLFELTDLIIKKDTHLCLKFIDLLMDKGFDLRQFTSEIISHFRSIAIVLTTDKPADIIHTSAENLNRIKDQANQFEVFEALKAIDLLSDTYRQMRFSGDVRMLLEIALIKLTKLEVDISVEGLLYRIEELEKSQRKIPQNEPESQQEQKSAVAKDKIIEKTSKDNEQSSETNKKTNKVKVQVGNSGIEPDAKKDNKQSTQEDDNSGEKAKEAGEAKKNFVLDGAKVGRVWPIVLQKIKETSIPLYSLLLECHLGPSSGSAITLVFNKSASFHLKEVSKDFNLTMVKKALKSVMGSDIGVECELEDLDSAQKKAEKKSTSLSANHVVKMMQDSFGAEIIEETTINKEEE